MWFNCVQTIYKSFPKQYISKIVFVAWFEKGHCNISQILETLRNTVPVRCSMKEKSSKCKYILQTPQAYFPSWRIKTYIGILNTLKISLFKKKLFIIVNFCLIQHFLKLVWLWSQENTLSVTYFNTQQNYSRSHFENAGLLKCIVFTTHTISLNCNCLTLKSKFTSCNLRCQSVTWGPWALWIQ